ncbi:hypothetical protein cypCar_00017273 [Cyprinus carpio]|nr:hypothetical protein cypCar_00017273 [Cyprinus carpio]
MPFQSIKTDGLTLHLFKPGAQASFPISLAPRMASDEYNPVSLRQKSKKKNCRGSPRMSRRRVSVKDLDPVDHQGWLYRKKEGKGFLGIKWKKYWFVLKRTSLYWYTNQMMVNNWSGSIQYEPTEAHTAGMLQ